jgi:predicted transcriptional regulator
MRELLSLTVEIVSAHVSHNNVATIEMPALIRSTFDALSSVSAPQVQETPKLEPAVPIRASVRSDHIICLEDGSKLQMLKRYLRNKYGMSPEEYRAKWDLPKDYPMVAPAYAERRRAIAKSTGLGRKTPLRLEGEIAP